MTDADRLTELRRMRAAQLDQAIALLLRAIEAFLDLAPKRSDAAAAAVSAMPDAHFATVVTASAASIEVRAGAESVEVFRHDFDAPTEFDMGEST